MSEEQTNFKYISNEPDYRHLHDKVRYKALYEEVGTVKANQEIRWREEWMRHFCPKTNASILELGAHNGPNLLHYGRLGHDVTGVELSETLVSTFELCKSKEPISVQNRVRMIQGWIEEFSPQQKYDCVLVTEVLEHVSDPVAILKKAAECVSQNGEIYISSPTAHWGNNTHVRGVPPSALKQWLHQADLAVKKIFIEEHGWTFAFATPKKSPLEKLISIFRK